MEGTAMENGSESPPSTTFNEMKMTSTCSPKKSRRAMQKRVVSVPIKDVEGSRLKGESAPPSDSWAWRKYGQKPIKGSPYPRCDRVMNIISLVVHCSSIVNPEFVVICRGYYRCSSSKGCPARKQVERSSVDPTMLVITYSCEHNHPWPLPSRNNHHHHHSTKPSKPEPQPEPEPEEKFTDLPDDALIMTATPDDQFAWFGDMETTTSTVLQSPIFADTSRTDADVAMFFPMREEDESLFADLGELPECSVVFRHRNLGPEVPIY
ncbi:hypothetical protein Ddye_024282 [Dipteronia dyeriana]|uniref:WRKY domain-containing protein n=1 Tax=Dipteronia dyeriana TaxID=168575 RepID=A0AAD9TUK9_9ROSI|nr:hypothetical protein Ddye_024282 [Dipteronia dyeriana]